MSLPLVMELVEPVWSWIGAPTMLCSRWKSDPSRSLTHHPTQVFCYPAIHIHVAGQREWRRAKEGQQVYFETRMKSGSLVLKPRGQRISKDLQEAAAAGSAAPGFLMRLDDPNLSDGDVTATVTCVCVCV